MDASDGLIESGSHVPGVDPAMFGLPPMTALRYERPADDLAPYVADYHVLDSIRPADLVSTEVMLPGGPAARFIMVDHDFELAIGGSIHNRLPKAALYGSPSKGAQMRVGRGGVTVGVTLTAAGLARLNRIDAHAVRDRVVPLDTVLDAKWVGQLHADLRASDQGPAVKALLDAALRPVLVRPHLHHLAIQRIAAAVATPGLVSVAAVREVCGMAQRQLERMTKRFFGFPPKLLLRRARFLRSIVALRMAGKPYDFSLIDIDYYDQSHFTRDAHRFLGMPPLQFLRTPSPYRDAALRARSIVIGAPLAALDPVPLR